MFELAPEMQFPFLSSLKSLQREFLLTNPFLQMLQNVKARRHTFVSDIFYEDYCRLTHHCIYSIGSLVMIFSASIFSRDHYVLFVLDSSPLTLTSSERRYSSFIYGELPFFG